MVINAAMKPGSRQMTDWLRALLLRKPRKLAAVALANKMGRIAWAMMTSGVPARLIASLPSRAPCAVGDGVTAPGKPGAVLGGENEGFCDQA